MSPVRISSKLDQKAQGKRRHDTQDSTKESADAPEVKLEAEARIEGSKEWVLLPTADVPLEGPLDSVRQGFDGTVWMDGPDIALLELPFITSLNVLIHVSLYSAFACFGIFYCTLSECIAYRIQINRNLR